MKNAINISNKQIFFYFKAFYAWGKCFSWRNAIKGESVEVGGDSVQIGDESVEAWKKNTIVL